MSLQNQRLNNQAILIIALSARPLACDAHRAGFNVTTIDAFADAQTMQYSEKSIVIDYGINGFRRESLLNKISQLDAESYLGFVYGSGFDAQPALLQQIAQTIPLLGNLSTTVEKVKNCVSFFHALKVLNIAHPVATEVTEKLLDTTNRYLKKSAGGCGGTHISWASGHDKLQTNEYFQQYVEGRSVSLLFLAHMHGVEVVGFNEQWVSESQAQPFRYGGAVSNIKLSYNVKQQLITAAEKLSSHFGLLGLNSLDTVIRDDIAYILEVNPRLSATVSLYEDMGLFERHVEAVQSKKVTGLSDAGSEISKAEAIVYADEALKISTTFCWPDWVNDYPAKQASPVTVIAGTPICTVHAIAEVADDARQLAIYRAKMLLELLKQ